MMLGACLALLWIVSGVLTYGLLNADWKWRALTHWTSIDCSTREIFAFAPYAMAIGPAGLLVMLLSVEFGAHGFTLVPWKTVRGALQ